ncbi:uncharacterized protein LOC113296913 isoform X2 [Papaver somniferum]|uniref:uncharacterized protein LOC113296913 isoform X2 n=1 Tax=Papaver somniferum TaxID=3469 RepID=UPI000E6F620B|nr:uncharacterized protein LOC113296913 isoform X2 [Papaver somniferum]
MYHQFGMKASLVFLLSTLLFEVLIVTAVLGLDWHRDIESSHLRVAPLSGLRLGASYMFLMAVGWLLRAIHLLQRFCHQFGHGVLHLYMFPVPSHPHSWAQTYYVPYSSDATAIWQLIQHDIAYVTCTTISHLLTLLSCCIYFVTNYQSFSSAIL